MRASCEGRERVEECGLSCAHPACAGDVLAEPYPKNDAHCSGCRKTIRRCTAHDSTHDARQGVTEGIGVTSMFSQYFWSQRPRNSTGSAGLVMAVSAMPSANASPTYPAHAV